MANHTAQTSRPPALKKIGGKRDLTIHRKLLSDNNLFHTFVLVKICSSKPPYPLELTPHIFRYNNVLLCKCNAMENIPHGLKEAIENDELVLFIGAGLSWDLKNTEGKTLGGWKEMVSSILSFLKDKEYITAEEQQSYDKLEPIGALKKLEEKGISRREIGDFLKHYFTLEKSKKLPIHKKAFRLSTKIITTNYDRAFEIAFPELQEIKAYKTKDYELNKLKKDPIFLFKLHGCIEHIDSMVLFPSDYDKLYKSTGREAEHALYALRNLIFNKTFLFIGTGMGDPQITSFFEEIKRTQGIYNQEHFIITFEPLKESLNFLTLIKINDKKEIPGVIDQLLDIKKDADAKKSSEKKLLLEQLKASKKEKEAHEKELNKEKDKNKRQALLLKREANNRFRTGLKHHQAKEYLEAAKEYKAATELKPEYSEAYISWGIALDDIAETKSRNEAEELYKEACKKYNLATKYKKDYHKVYFIWGLNLSLIAVTKSGCEAEELYEEACKKYDEATTYKQDYHEAYYYWGTALMELAKTKSGSEAEELYNEAFEKYNLATKYKKDKHEAYYNWANALMELAETKSGSEAEELYKEAFEKYNLATTYKQDDHEAYNNWGNVLGDLAQTKSGSEAEELYKEACEKYNKATTYKQNNHKAYYNWGNVLGDLAQTKSGSEAEELYKEACEKYNKATQYKPDFYEAYNNWGSALRELAQTKSSNEAEELYKEACEKYKLATTYKKDKHEAYYNWGITLVELAKTKSGSEAEELHKEAFKKYNLAFKYGGGAYNLACLYAIRNQKAEALKYLDIALSRNEITINFVEQDEDWKELRNDPDFQDLLSRYKK